MANKPYASESKNVISETTYSISPNTFGLSNVQATLVTNRSTSNTSSVSIPNFPPTRIFPSNPYSRPPHLSASKIQTYREFIPGGVNFTFRPCSNLCQQCPTTNMNSSVPLSPHPFPPPPGPAYQQCSAIPTKTCHPFLESFQQPRPDIPRRYSMCECRAAENSKFKFHHNANTSTSDLLSDCSSQVPISKGHPDFVQLSGIISDLSNQIELMTKNAVTLENPSLIIEKRAKFLLTLTKSPDLAVTRESIRERDKAPLLEKKEQQEKKCEVETNEKKVSFEEKKEEKEKESKNVEPCCSKTEEKKRKSRNKRQKKRTNCCRIEADDSSSTSSDDDCQLEQKNCQN